MNGVPWWFVQGLPGVGDEPLDSVDPGGAVARAIPLPHVMGCVVHLSAATAEPGLVVQYQLDSIQGLGLQVELLYRNGYANAWGWSNSALQADGRHRSPAPANAGGTGWNATNTSRQMPWLAQRAIRHVDPDVLVRHGPRHRVHRLAVRQRRRQHHAQADSEAQAQADSEADVRSRSRPAAAAIRSSRRRPFAWPGRRPLRRPACRPSSPGASRAV